MTDDTAGLTWTMRDMQRADRVINTVERMVIGHVTARRQYATPIDDLTTDVGGGGGGATGCGCCDCKNCVDKSQAIVVCDGAPNGATDLYSLGLGGTPFGIDGIVTFNYGAPADGSSSSSGDGGSSSDGGGEDDEEDGGGGCSWYTSAVSICKPASTSSSSSDSSSSSSGSSSSSSACGDYRLRFDFSINTDGFTVCKVYVVFVGGTDWAGVGS